MSEQLFTCQKCKRVNFTKRGLSAHRCAPVASPSPMSKPTKPSLELASNPSFAVKGDELSRLQKGVIEQFKIINQLQDEAAVRAVLTGTALIRIKASMKHGTFMAWHTKHIKVGKSQVSNYMRLAQVFIDSTKAAKPAALALPGDQLSLEPAADKARFAKDALAWCKGLSITDLLIKHGIKAVGLKTALQDSDTGTPTAGADDEYFTEVAATLYGFREIATSREKLMRLTTAQLATFDQTVTDTYSEFKKLLAEAKGGPAIAV